MRTFIKIISCAILCALLLIAVFYATFVSITADAKLDKTKLVNYGNQIIVLDENGTEISNTFVNGKYQSVLLKELKKDTIYAFLASEDEHFYKHNGLNYKRMVKALFTNVAARSFKEGASTISQQLIKNTHLSNDKTIKRKLCEIKLTKKLEKEYSKDQILEMYLNTIYFGHGCYGLQSAANFYFDKSAEDLTLNESATLVGLLSSPNNYSPFKNEEKCLVRRNLVLKRMKDCNFIDENIFNFEIKKPICAKKSSIKTQYSDYIAQVFEELQTLNIDVYKMNDGCKIKTYLQPEMQNFLEEINFENDNSVVITSNDTLGVRAFKSSINNAKRPPGSTIKPLLVYAPAINEKLINTFTHIKDEKINFNGYSPENYNKKYHGDVTVEESIKNSLNVPAVKVLNSLTVEKAENYAKKLNINLQEEEKNLSLALGGMKYGLSLKDICDAYSTFPNAGNFEKSAYIDKIYDKNGKIIYNRERFSTNVFSQGTCSLINETLIQTAKSGTAKKLKTLPFDVAAKTGTCGNKDGNTDAYALCYTSKHTIGIWLGDANNEKLQITGGGDCCKIALGILQKIYKENQPNFLETKLGTKTINIDKEEYEKNKKIALVDDIAPIVCKKQVKVLKDFTLVEKMNNFSKPTIKLPEINVKNNKISIKLCHTKYYLYIVNRQFNGNFNKIYEGKYKNEIIDTVDNNGTYTYTITPYYIYNDNKYFGETITLPSVIVGKIEENPQSKIPDIAYGDWYLQ